MDFFVFGGFHAETEADHRGGGLQPLRYQPCGLRLRHLREHYNKAGSKLFRGGTTWTEDLRLDFAERDKCKPVLLRLSLAGNLEKPLMCPSMGPNGGSVAIDSESGLMANGIYEISGILCFLADFLSFCSYSIQHCFICRPSDSTVPTDAGIEPRTIATGALAVRRSNH